MEAAKTVLLMKCVHLLVKNAARMHMLGYKQRAENVCDQQVYN